MTGRDPDPNRPARQLAHLRLGVTPEQVSRAPQITPQLRTIARTLRGTGQRPRYVIDENYRLHTRQVAETAPIESPYGPGGDLPRSWPLYLQATDLPDAAAVLGAYYSLPKSLAATLPIEAFCVAAGVSPLRILEIITGVCVRTGAQAAILVAAVNQARVVEKSVEMALTDEGIADRLLLARATQFIAPAAKGPSVTVSVSQQQSANAQAQAAALPAPPPESTIRRLVDRLNAKRLADQPAPAQLTEGRGTPLPTSLAIPVTAELMDDERDD